MNFPRGSIFNSESVSLICPNGDCTIQNLDIVFDARGADYDPPGLFQGIHSSFIFLAYKNTLLAKLVGKYDFLSYPGSGDEIEDSISKKMAVFSTGDKAPKWESGELKFIKGNEFIQLVDSQYFYEESILRETFSSVTVNIWIKLEEPPTSSAYIFTSQLKGIAVKISYIP